jgi:acylphosphatase
MTNQLHVAMQRLHLNIRGRVQGVFFRAHTQEEAKRLGIKGFVQNTPDGKVEAVAEGEKAVLEKFLEWCGHGPSMAMVDGVDAEWSEATGEFKEFGIRY